MTVRIFTEVGSYKLGELITAPEDVEDWLVEMAIGSRDLKKSVDELVADRKAALAAGTTMEEVNDDLSE